MLTSADKSCKNNIACEKFSLAKYNISPLVVK